MTPLSPLRFKKHLSPLGLFEMANRVKVLYHNYFPACVIEIVIINCVTQMQNALQNHFKLFFDCPNMSVCLSTE